MNDDYNTNKKQNPKDNNRSKVNEYSLKVWWLCGCQGINVMLSRWSCYLAASIKTKMDSDMTRLVSRYSPKVFPLGVA